MNGHRRNALYGLLGFLVPTLVTLASYPVLVFHLGTEAVGVYMLSNMLAIGWSVFDCGISFAIVKLVAEDHARGDADAAGRVIATSLAFYGTIGVVLAVVLWFLAPTLAHLFRVSDLLWSDAVWTFRLGSLRFAIFFLTQVFIGVFKGLYRFGPATIVLSLLSLLTYGGAMIAVLVANAGLVDISIIVLVGNAGVFLATMAGANVYCGRRGIHFLKARPDRRAFVRTFSFGIFLNANYVAYALVIVAGPMLLSSFLGPASAAVFNIASTVTTRAMAAFNALYEFILPMTSARAQTLDSAGAGELRRIYLKALAIGASLSATGFGLIAGLAPEITHLWLPQGIEREVASILRLLCFGAAFASVAQVIYHFVNGLGRPAINAIFVAAFTATTYTLFALFSVSGVTVAGFATAQTLGFAAYGIGLAIFGEMVVWRRWVPRLVNKQGLITIPS